MKIAKLIILGSSLLVIVLLFSFQAHADLNLLGQGTSVHGTYNLIYDTDLDITWYDYSNTTPTQGIYNHWGDKVSWADALLVSFGSNTYSEWRLPYTFSHCIGGDCTNSEMGHLYYTELGNKKGGPPCCGLQKTGDFQNLLPDYYWSGTSYSSGEGWYFNFNLGSQGHYNVGNHDYAIAVMDGMAVVPEPISSILFITGGTLLAGRRFIK